MIRKHKVASGYVQNDAKCSTGIVHASTSLQLLQQAAIFSHRHSHTDILHIQHCRGNVVAGMLHQKEAVGYHVHALNSCFVYKLILSIHILLWYLKAFSLRFAFQPFREVSP